MATKKKSNEASKHSRNNKRKAAYAALAGKGESASQKRARLKARRAVKLVGSTVKHPIRPCGNHACRSCYERDAR